MGDNLQYQYTLNDVLQELIQTDSFEQLDDYNRSFLKDLIKTAVRQIRYQQKELKHIQTSCADAKPLFPQEPNP